MTLDFAALGQKFAVWQHMTSTELGFLAAVVVTGICVGLWLKMRRNLMAAIRHGFAVILTLCVCLIAGTFFTEIEVKSLPWLTFDFAHYFSITIIFALAFVVLIEIILCLCWLFLIMQRGWIRN